MTKQQTNLSNRYLITPSLLNSWRYIWTCEINVREFPNDTMCREDKVTIAQEKAYQEFLTTLRREKTEPNEYMLRGIEFEKECYDGNTCISPIIQGGCYQAVGKKNVRVDDMDFLMYGRLDVLKGGIIYDIKRVSHYEPPKYNTSYQHKFYMDLFPYAKKFQYLIYDGKKLHIETYYPDECEPTENAISQFITWLKENNLLELYKEKWRSK